MSENPKCKELEKFTVLEKWIDPITGGEFSFTRLPIKNILLTNDSDPLEIMTGIIIQCVRLDGNALTKDEVLNMGVTQFNKLVAKLLEING